MSFKIKRQATDDADIDVTSFMNLMIVLVPVLLMSMTFTKITVMEINLPELSGGSSAASLSQSQLEIVVRKTGLKVYFPAGSLIKDIPLMDHSEHKNKVHDFNTLSQVLRSIKDKVSDKKDIVILSSSDLSYQDLISTMDTVKSYQTVVAASLVEIELFPEISLGDATKVKKGA
ncbi:MAG: biopolymer transport protein ExbD [Crocinitomicaceae bacterium]|jgi:biopolymer transport protein ExbD